MILPRRPVPALAYLSVAFVLGATVAVTLLVDTELVLLNDTLFHPTLFGIVAILTGGLGVRELVRPVAWARAATVTAMVVALLVWLRIGLVWSIFSSTEIGFVDGPGPLSVRVIEQWGMFESTATLSVRTDEGLFSREWPLECPGFDMDEGELHLVRWVGADRVEVHLPDEEPFGVDLDPATGRPVDACR
ncbi:hypothetical protein [Nonomuraea dietziae]|uniref:Uncharacterized protein n=1 Tax=Nonomuraea dietziae TaxID=65515 RepID=A0A7W5V000_9ACTN|nr:hypothetical protein [Nonomuraea dietziae]MBB3727827.1 hypothetical protein [Nonomuraea dietziae]